MNEKRMNFDAYEPPIPRAEVVLNTWVEVNATMIDPETGANLVPIARKVGAEIRRSSDSQLVVISRKGQELENDIGEERFQIMLSNLSYAINELVIRLLPKNLIKAFLHGLPNARQQLIEHYQIEEYQQKEGIDFPWGRVALLSIGGQSMAVKVTYDSGVDVKKEFVVKTTSPLALTTEPTSAVILSPMTSELLRREVIIQHPIYKAASESRELHLNQGLIATPYFMIEDFIQGQTPRSSKPNQVSRVVEFQNLLRTVIEDYIKNPPGGGIEILMSGIDCVDTVSAEVTSQWPVALEQRPVKTTNFIISPGRGLYCIDPFVPKVANRQKDEELDHTTKSEDIVLSGVDDRTEPFPLSD